jgi:hypothetical protein
MMKPRTFVIIILNVLSFPALTVGRHAATLERVLYQSDAPVASAATQFLNNVRTDRIEEA